MNIYICKLTHSCKTWNSLTDFSLAAPWMLRVRAAIEMQPATMTFAFAAIINTGKMNGWKWMEPKNHLFEHGNVISKAPCFGGSMLVNLPGCSGLMVWGDPWPIQLRVWCVSDLSNCIILLRVLESGDCYQLRLVVHPRLSHYLQGGCTYQIMQGFFHHQ